MTDEQVKVVIGGLLHDVGKVIYRQGGDRRKHSRSGYDFLKDEAQLCDESVLDSVLYHHADLLKNADIAEDSFAYITYIADNIAASADRRSNDSEDTGFEISMPLQSVFNILNGNHQKYYYEPKMLNPEEEINYPGAEKKAFDEHFYGKVKENLLTNLIGIQYDADYINSLLDVLEANLSFVPSSTAKNEMADISLYDHMKLTAAVGSCILEYLQEAHIMNYKNELFTNAKIFYGKEVFLLYSMDISGIQDFIYTITSKRALKTLRARSFYLEIMMEHMIDSMLQELQLSRANLLYSGGGHCYLLLANTDRTKKILEQYNKKINQWLKDTFTIALYVADGYAACSSDTLKNEPNGSYSDLFRNVGNAISKKKANRYTAEDIIQFNKKENEDYSRECKVCRKIGRTNEKGLCEICSAIEGFSKNILFDDFFAVSLKKTENSLPLPGDYYLTSENQDSLKRKMQEDDYFVRSYSKNKMFTGKYMATKLWVGNYSSGKDFKQLAEESTGVDRIGVLRADVDNLGQAFVSGFENPENHNKYVTLSRTATLSRQLSMFFKLYLNRILGNAVYRINGETGNARNVTICYSGGDDLFIVGSWDEIIEATIDIRRCFEKYVQGTLTISAGIGIYSPGYPISVIAKEVADLEEKSKKNIKKNSVTLLEDGEYHSIEKDGDFIDISDGTYTWEEFEEYVLGEKYQVLKEFFDQSEDRGMNFMYHLLELIRNRDQKINFARYVYLLSRMEPDRKADQLQKENYNLFSKKMYEWIKDEKDSRHLKTAMTLYAYMNREVERNED